MDYFYGPYNSNYDIKNHMEFEEIGGDGLGQLCDIIQTLKSP
jgi:hypothetical protein